ncbi:MAG: PspA/IM30 family protein [Candidatus Cyclobacteriaceae bacterium M3_2C_046]
MGIFNRLFKIGQSEAHSAIDKLENPIKLTEQGIRDLKNDLNNSLQSLAQVKAMAIRSKNEMATYKNQANDYESKALKLLERAESGGIDPNEADRLASEALAKKEEALQQAARSTEEKEKFDQSVAQLEQNVKKLKQNISKWENELKTLKARAKVADATKNLNKQMSQIDSSSTVSMLERMKDKVAEDEALAQSYGEIANESKSLDEEIDKALDDTSSRGSDALAALKAKMAAKKNQGEGGA